MTTQGWAVLWCAAALSGLLFTACENSILRNTTEAGLETVLEKPLPTPTVGRK
jgi:hypothetical protein